LRRNGCGWWEGEFC